MDLAGGVRIGAVSGRKESVGRAGCGVPGGGGGGWEGEGEGEGEGKQQKMAKS